MTTALSARERRQRDYFECARNRYPTSALLDPPVHTILELRRVIEALADVDRHAPIVDFGAGTGRLTLALARAGFSVLAVDLSQSSLEVLQTVARQAGVHGIETGTELPAAGRAPAVVGADVLHHVCLDDQLPRIHATLAPGGKAVFSEPGALNPTWYAYLALTHSMAVEARIVTCTIPYLRRRFARHGFRDVRITGVGILPRPLFARSARACDLHDRVGQWPVLRWFACRYLITAHKAP